MKEICFVHDLSWNENCTKVQTVIQLILTIFITGWEKK